LPGLQLLLHQNQLIFGKSPLTQLVFEIMIRTFEIEALHRVLWTLQGGEQNNAQLRDDDEKLVEKIYLLEDCTSPVVVPGVVDYTNLADQAFKEFSDAGMKVVRSIDLLSNWPGINL